MIIRDYVPADVDALIDLVTVGGKLGRAGGAAPGREGRNLDHLCLRVEDFDEVELRRELQAGGALVGDHGSRDTHAPPHTSREFAGKFFQSRL